MKKSTTAEVIPTVPGTPFGGGFYAGRFVLRAEAFALIVAPKAEGELELAWNKSPKEVKGALSYNDGLANTLAMAKAGSDLAKQIRALKIGGMKDWYLPSRLEALLLFGELRDAKGFNKGAEAFALDAYWTSTQSASSSDCAWYQNFDYGTQNYLRKSVELRARAVRRLPI